MQPVPSAREDRGVTTTGWRQSVAAGGREEARAAARRYRSGAAAAASAPAREAWRKACTAGMPASISSCRPAFRRAAASAHCSGGRFAYATLLGRVVGGAGERGGDEGGWWARGKWASAHAPPPPVHRARQQGTSRARTGRALGSRTQCPGSSTRGACAPATPPPPHRPRSLVGDGGGTRGGVGWVGMGMVWRASSSPAASRL